MGESANGAGLDAEAMMAMAVEQTGLSDFGPPSFREGLDVYCASVGEAQLNDIGAMVAPANVVGALSNRLKVIDWAKSHPEVADEEIEAPFVVVGIFRAGTTLLSYLLEKDERHRPLFGWEAQDSVPPVNPRPVRAMPASASDQRTRSAWVGGRRGGTVSSTARGGAHPGSRAGRQDVVRRNRR